MNSKPPARRRSCLKAQNTNVESDTSDGTGLLEKDDTGTISLSLPRKRVSFSHKKEIKEFKNVSIDERDHSPMEMVVQQQHQSGQNVKNNNNNNNDDGVDENVMPVVDMSMTYTLPMGGDGTFVIDSTRQDSNMCMSFTKEKPNSSSNKKRRSTIQDATFIIDDLSHHNHNVHYQNPENDMSMSRVVFENELPNDENVPISQHQQQQHFIKTHQKLEAEKQQEEQLRTVQFNSTNNNNIEQPNPYGISPDMSLTISGESQPAIEPPSEFHDNPNVLVYQNVDLNYIPKQQQQYEKEQEQYHLPEMSMMMMMESMVVQQNRTEYNPNLYHTEGGISNNHNNMSMTVDLNPSKIPLHYNSTYQYPQQTRREDDRDMSITMNENEASQLDKTGFYYETYEEEEEEREEEGAEGEINSEHPNHTQYFPDASMTMDLDSRLIKLSSTQIKSPGHTQEYSDMSITMAVPNVASSSSSSLSLQLNSVHMNENQIATTLPHHISNVYSTIVPNDETETENDDETAGKRRRQTYTISEGNKIDDNNHRHVFKAPIPTLQNQNYYKNKVEMRKSTVPVPENSAFGRFGSVKTPRRKLPDDITSLMLAQPKEQPKTLSVQLARGEEKKQQKIQETEVIQDSCTTTTTSATTTSDQASSSVLDIKNPVNEIPPEIMRSNSTIITDIDITRNVEPYTEYQSIDTQTTACNKSKISTPAVEKLNNHPCSSSNPQSLNYHNFKIDNSWTPALSSTHIPQDPFKIPVVQTSHVASVRKIHTEPTNNNNMVTTELKEFKESTGKQKIILSEIHGQQQQKSNNSTKEIKSVHHAKGNKHVITLEDKIVQLKLLKGLRLQWALSNFSRDLQSFNDSKFSKTINEITGFVNPDFIQAVIKIREYEAVMKIQEFPTNPEDQLFIFVKRKLSELYGENLDETF